MIIYYKIADWVISYFIKQPSMKINSKEDISYSSTAIAMF